MKDDLYVTYSYLQERVATQCKHLNLGSTFPSHRAAYPGEVHGYTFDKTSSSRPRLPYSALFDFLSTFCRREDEEDKIEGVKVRR